MLLEKQADQPMARALRASLWLHLHYCPYCNRYAKQTVLIAEWARASAASRASSKVVLSDNAKQRMRERLAAAG
ncbi:hypothetical protein GCM10022407_14010 [Hymenobacter antarcticus]|uniref:Zinc-finger domain-containing protein n=2 Tax=Hymenobacter antarcticus TaxID=486270 RepID=A0ABP7PPR8_9BACT